MTKRQKFKLLKETNSFPICVKNLDHFPNFEPANLTAITLLRYKTNYDTKKSSKILSFVTSSSSEIRNSNSVALLMPLCMRLQFLLDDNQNMDFLGPIEVQHQKEPSQEMLIYLHTPHNRSLVFCFQYERYLSSKISSYTFDPLFQHIVRRYITMIPNNFSKNYLNVCTNLKRYIDKFLYLQEQKNQIGLSCFNLGTTSQLCPDYEQIILACLDLIGQNKYITIENLVLCLNARGKKIERDFLKEMLLNLSFMGYLQEVIDSDPEGKNRGIVYQLK
ncbi:MAG: hypothetical protein ACFFBD_23580 [Candidatus Hodarchaeota archaeon]